METPKIPPSDVLPPHGQVSLLTTKIPPPSALYVSLDDKMELDVWNSLPGLQVRLSVRFLRPDGVVVPTIVFLTPTSDRTRNTFAIDITEGFILSVTVTPTLVAPLRGQTFCTVVLVRGPTLAAFSHQVLVQDYIFNLNYAGWPGGTIRSPLEGPGVMRSIVGTDPAAGAEISETVPTNARWRLIALRTNLATSIVVVNRRVKLLLDDGVNVYAEAYLSTNIVASTNPAITWAEGYVVFANSDNQQMSVLPQNNRMRSGFRIRTSTPGLDAGDNFAAPVYLVEEWIEP